MARGHGGGRIGPEKKFWKWERGKQNDIERWGNKDSKGYGRNQETFG